MLRLALPARSPTSVRWARHTASWRAARLLLLPRRPPRAPCCWHTLTPTPRRSSRRLQRWPRRCATVRRRAQSSRAVPRAHLPTAKRPLQTDAEYASRLCMDAATASGPASWFALVWGPSPTFFPPFPAPTNPADVDFGYVTDHSLIEEGRRLHLSPCHHVQEGRERDAAVRPPLPTLPPHPTPRPTPYALYAFPPSPSLLMFQARSVGAGPGAAS